MKKYLYLIWLLVLIGCSKVPEGYTKYETFDSYKLEGVNQNNFLNEPFVAVKKTKDSISIIVYLNDTITKRILIVNKGDFWLQKEMYFNKEYAKMGCRCYQPPRYTEAYYYNDTMLVYDYYMEKDKVVKDESIYLNTKQSRISLQLYNDPNDKSIINKKKELDILKKMILEFNKKNENNLTNQNSKCFYYNKKISGDTLFLYNKKINDGYKLGCLYRATILNRLGEFYSSFGENITSKIIEKERCK